MKIATDDTDLTHDQWHLLRRFLPAAKKRGRPRTALREVINAILYLVKTGAQWRLLPKNFPPWQTVYHHFRQWTRNGLLARLNHRLRARVRQAVGKHRQPTAASLDSQTVRASAHGGQVGYDAAKKTKGRKRFLLVDTLGLLLDVTLEPADCLERKGVRSLLTTVLVDYPELRKLWVDGRGYLCKLCMIANDARRYRKNKVHILKRALEWKRETPDRCREHRLKCYWKNPEKWRARKRIEYLTQK